MAPALHPRALDILRSPGSFDPASPRNIGRVRLRELMGSDLPDATPIDASTVIEHWVDYIVGLILDKKDCVVMCDGTPGEGKSTFSLWLCLLVRQALNQALGTRQNFEVERDICYRLSDLIHRILQSSRENPSVILADEGVLVGAQARAGSYDASLLLDRVLSLSRIQGATLFILAPSIWGLASAVRDRRARLWFHVERRGLSTAFILREAIPFKRPKELPFSKARQPWSKLRWDSLESDPVWAPYEARKITVTKSALHDSEVEALKVEKKLGLSPPAWADAFYRKAVLGRQPGETPTEYHRRGDRERKRLKAAEKLRQSVAGAPLTGDAAVPG
jgi:hypothetical protein